MFQSTMMNNASISAITFALKLLGMRNHSHKELEQKLRKKGYPSEEIESVLNTLTTRGLLNDQTFGHDLIRSRSRRKPAGTMKMSMELRKKGVSEAVINELLQEYDSTSLCHQAAEKKIHTLRGATENEKRKKLEIFLRNRGFGWQEIQGVLKRFFDVNDDYNITD